MKSIFTKTLFALLCATFALTAFAKDPTEALDVKEVAGSDDYYSVEALPAIKNENWVGYSSTGSGNGGCITESHWKLNDNRTITFQIKNCDKIAINDSYFSKDATTNLFYSIEGSDPVSFATNGDLKKTCASGEFSTDNSGEIKVTISADNDVALGTILFYVAGGSSDPDPQDEGEPFVQSFSFDNMVAGSDAYDEDNLAIKAKIKFGSDRTNIKPTFKGKNISDNWTPVSADFEANETNTFTFQYTKSGKVKNYEVTITEAEKDPDPIDPPAEGEWLIKGTTQQEVSGPAAGSVETNLSKKDELKLDKKKYFGLILDNGYALQENDVFVINITTAADLGKCVLFADKEGNEVLYDEGIEYSKDEPSATGEKAIVLPAAVAGKTAIYLWREDGATQWNPTFNYIGIKRDGIEVVTVDVTGVKLDQSSISLEEGKSQTLTATVAPADATNKKVTWESSDDAVATVSNGKVTAVAEGSATITVKTDDGGFTATCDVTVTKKETPIDPPADDEGEFTTRTITDNGAVSTWTFNQRSSAFSVKEAEPIIDNEMIFAPNGDGNIKFQTSSYLSCKGESTIGVPVPADGAGTIAITTSSSSDGRWFQLYINQEEGTEQQRLWSKQADEITDNKKGPQSFEFTSADLTTYQGKTYLHFKDNNAEMKIASFIVTLTSGAYDGSSTPPSDPVAVTGVSLDKETLELEEGKSQTLSVTIEPSDATNKKVTWESSDDAVATVSNGKVTAVAEGSATITVKTDDGDFTATCKVTVTKKSEEPDPELPDVGLTAHVPDIYDDPLGYKTPLSVFNGYEYEVYYMTRDSESKFCIATTNADKTQGITTLSSDYSCAANDGWFRFSGTGWSSASDKPGEEFEQMSRRLDMDNKSEFVMQFKGYDQFAIVGRDKKIDDSAGQTKPENNRYLEVYIDEELQPLQFNTNPSIRRYDVSSKEHVVRIIHHGSEKSAMYAFSLRVAQEPRVKYFDGNDSTQKVLQTSDIKPVVYFAKYAQMGQVKLEWSGATAEGITLETLAQTDLGDSIALSGQANCPVGTYNYAVVTYFGGKETARAKGKFSVISDIKATSDLIVNAYTGEEMEQITFKYYALSADDVKVTWPNGQPDGISGKGNNGIYTIGGTPTAAGEYPFSVTVTGSETVIEGKIKIQTIDIGSNAVLYLYKTNGAEEKDGLFTYLKKNWNPIARKTIDDLRDPEQYAKYQWIFISEDADSDNPEVLALIKGGSSLPIFSVNGFTYTKDRLDWGEPDNGALTEEALSLTVQRDDHPIFKKLGKKQGSKVQVLSNENLGKKGLMPIRVTLSGTHCLATAWTRDINDYNGNGEQQTILHEIPAKMRGGEKYICLPIAASSTDNLSAEGKQLIDAIISYLLDGSVSPVFLPTLQINRFTLGGVDGVIDQANYTIEVEMTDEQFNELDSLRAAKPVITLADPTYSHVEPAADKEQDFRFSSFIPVVYTVTDYINRLPYAVSLRIKNTQGIDEVYTVGEWVNIFDVYGRKVATTNEDIHAMPLPNGMYIVVTESGQTLKIMR